MGSRRSDPKHRIPFFENRTLLRSTNLCPLARFVTAVTAPSKSMILGQSHHSRLVPNSIAPSQLTADHTFARSCPIRNAPLLPSVPSESHTLGIKPEIHGCGVISALSQKSFCRPTPIPFRSRAPAKSKSPRSAQSHVRQLSHSMRGGKP